MYLFDIDGTLLLTGGAGSRAINAIFVDHFGVTGAMDLIAAGGKTDEMILHECAINTMGRRLLASEIAAILKAYVPMLAKEMHIETNFQIMPHVEACLDFVRQEQKLVGIATGNVQAAAEAKLERAGLRNYFHFGGYGCDSAVRRELVAIAMQRGRAMCQLSLSDSHFVVVGDTLHDIEAARSCGARVIAVATGATSREDLQKAQPDALFDTLAELPAWHKQHFAFQPV